MNPIRAFTKLALALLMVAGFGLAPGRVLAGVAADVEGWVQAHPAEALPQSMLDRQLTKDEARQVTDLLVNARRERIRAEKTEANEVTAEGVTMRYETVRFDDEPSDTPRSLFISMHGGGSGPAQMNDSQWRNQVALAKAYQPKHAIYIAPRAPANDWNLWHKAHIDPLFDRLIERAVTFEGVDPYRVYLMGYSAGGDGVFQLAPRMADRFAAAAMMAGHPNEANPLGLRNLPFTIHVGGLDAAYHRNEVAPAWGAKLEELQRADPAGYESWTWVHPDRPHWMKLEDKAAIPWMQKFKRNALPERVVWYQDDVTHDRFYWLAVPSSEARKGDTITAERKGQSISITTSRPMPVIVRLSDAMLDLDQPVEIERDGKRTTYTPRRTVGAIAKTLDERGDAVLTFSAEIDVPAASSDNEGPAPASPEVTAAMQPYLDGYKLAGIIAIIADKSGKIHNRNLLGHADVEAKRSISETDVFWIASMSKMFAGASIMMLADEGKVSLDDPVTKFIPQLGKWMVVEEKDASHILLKPLVRPVTVRHILSHTSGLAGSSELQQVTGSDSVSLKTRALSSVTGPLQSQPGDKYAYGNQGMNIAARIVELVSGMAYEDFLQKRFFDPLGMTETTFWPTEAQIARLAGAYGPNKEKTGYARGGISFLTKPYSDRTHRFPEAGGGLFSTTHDILRYGLMLANDGELEGKRYLSRAAIDELRKEQTGTTKVNYSLGYHLRNGMFGHDGAYGTDLSVDPKSGLVAVFMTQCTSGDQWAARDLFVKTAREVFQSSVKN